MAKVVNDKVEMTCTLTLTEKETAMMAWLAGFSAEAIAQAICSDISSRFPKEDWRALWASFRSELEKMHNRMYETRLVFQGARVATEIPKPVPK